MLSLGSQSPWEDLVRESGRHKERSTTRVSLELQILVKSLLGFQRFGKSLKNVGEHVS